jgi:hypothetical protein
MKLKLLYEDCVGTGAIAMGFGNALGYGVGTPIKPRKKRKRKKVMK